MPQRYAEYVGKLLGEANAYGYEGFDFTQHDDRIVSAAAMV
jgi:hypothetical protein